MHAGITNSKLSVAVTVEACWHRVPGGTGRAVLGLLEALLGRDDVSVRGLAASHREPPAAAFSLPPSLRVDHSHLPRRALYEYWHRRRGAALPGQGRDDVVHAAGGVMPPTAGAPLVATVHDVAFRHRPEHFTRNGVAVLTRALDIARSEAAAVICPSEATITDLVAEGFDTDRLHHLPLAVDAPRHDAASAAAVLSGLDVRGRYVLWVGTVEPRKNLPRLLEAFAIAAPPDVQLVLAGPDGWKQDLPTSTSAIADRLVCTGFVTDDQLSALYAGAEVFCFPSLLEGFGLPVAEAMAHGVPVITSTGTSTEELVGEAGICVDPTSVDAIATALRTLLSDQDRARSLGAAGASLAGGWTWSDYGDRLMEIYREVAG